MKGIYTLIYIYIYPVYTVYLSLEITDRKYRNIKMKNHDDHCKQINR